jgi:hypothetical protein
LPWDCTDHIFFSSSMESALRNVSLGLAITTMPSKATGSSTKAALAAWQRAISLFTIGRETEARSASPAHSRRIASLLPGSPTATFTAALRLASSASALLSG